MVIGAIGTEYTEYTTPRARIRMVTRVLCDPSGHHEATTDSESVKTLTEVLRLQEYRDLVDAMTKVTVQKVRTKGKTNWK